MTEQASFWNEEMVLVDGEVIDYAAGNPDFRPHVGWHALANKEDSPEYVRDPKTSVRVWLDNGRYRRKPVLGRAAL